MRFFTTVHLLLLAYVIAALVFWGMSLQKQSIFIFEQQRLTLDARVDSSSNPLLYASSLHELEKKRDTRTKQYIGEGSTFLLVILIGAAVVYSSFRRSIRLSRQQNNFMLSVTHELKSPIAAMKLNLQTLERHQLDESKRLQLLDRCINESNRLNDLCNNMLIASQMEGRQYVAAKEHIDFTALVEASLKEYTARYGSRFQQGDFEDTSLTGDKLLLHMAVNNLLENAAKYTPADKPVTVQLVQKNKMALLQVTDEGPGIPDKEKRKIFNKFYRVGNEETRKTKGTGLGLYLTLRIVKQHKGKIVVKDNVPNGAIFEIYLPLA
jgi:signal transduction histidine kinase